MAPVIAAASINPFQFWKTKSKVEAVIYFQVVKLAEDGEQIGIWVCRVLVQDIGTCKKASFCVMAEYFD